MPLLQELKQIEAEVVACRKCPRLVRYIGEIRKKYPDYWCKPVPGFGDPRAKILLLGLAPGRFGSNRTGRMFTGDASGKFLYRALHDLGLASRPVATDLKDGLTLKAVYITAAVRCAPPQNKPSPQELKNCAHFAQKEIRLLPELRVVVALGRVAHDAYLRLAGGKLSQYPFKHGAVHVLSGHPTLVDIYHPSRQNTQTGLLTMPMFKDVIKKAKKIAEGPSPKPASRQRRYAGLNQTCHAD